MYWNSPMSKKAPQVRTWQGRKWDAQTPFFKLQCVGSCGALLFLISHSIAKAQRSQVMACDKYDGEAITRSKKTPPISSLRVNYVLIIRSQEPVAATVVQRSRRRGSNAYLFLTLTLKWSPENASQFVLGKTPKTRPSPTLGPKFEPPIHYIHETRVPFSF